MRKLMVLIAVLALVGVASANLLTNPGFETQDPAGGATDAEDWWKYNNAGREDWADRSGVWGMAFWSWDNGAWGGFGQDVVGTFGSSYVVTFSIWGNAEVNFESTDSEAWLKLEFWQDGNTTWTREDIVDVYSTLRDNAGDWTLFYITSTVNLANVTMIKPIVGGGGFTNNNVGNQAVYWDDASFTVVPEPTAVALLGLGALLACALRRKAKS